MLWALIFWVLLAVSNFIFFPPFSYQVLAQCLFHYLNISCIHILTTGMYIYSYGETMSTHYWLYGQGSCLWPKEHILPCLYVLSWGNPMTVTTPLQSCTLSVTTCFCAFLPSCLFVPPRWLGMVLLVPEAPRHWSLVITNCTMPLAYLSLCWRDALPLNSYV